jgi:hypothetical protein
MGRMGRHIGRAMVWLQCINFALLVYLLIEKLTSTGCAACHRVPLLPVNDITITAAGTLSSLSLIIIIYLVVFRNIERLKLGSLIISLISASFGMFLLEGQLALGKQICLLCLIGTIIFYLTFCYMFYLTVLKETWHRLFGKQDS